MKGFPTNAAGWRAATGDGYPTMRSAAFITFQDFVSLAAQAYTSAHRKLVPPAGETWLDLVEEPAEFLAWSSAEDFASHLREAVRSRLERHAILTGHYRPPSADGSQLGGVGSPHADREPVADQDPATVGASVQADRNGSAAHADRFSLCPSGQELPPVGSVAHTQTAMGGRNDR